MDLGPSTLNPLERLLLDIKEDPIDLPFSLMRTITKNFSNDLRIGDGGFAVVYKGLLGNGGTVAVKKLTTAIDIDDDKFQRELGCLMSVRHKNIVRFLGYCADTQGKMVGHNGKFVMADLKQRLLCFEYLHNGSPEKYITDASAGLDWTKRYKIIKGICEGLHYLHKNNIVHLDLKPANILLNDNMVPKISDFGLSRCFGEEQSRAVTSKLVGSMGYLAPEFYNGEITKKLDIYSLGVIIAEMLTGQKGYTPVKNVLECWRNRFEPPDKSGTPDPDTGMLLEQIRVCATIRMGCGNLDPEERPDIEEIIKILNETKDNLLQVDIEEVLSSLTAMNSTRNMPNIKSNSWWWDNHISPQTSKWIDDKKEEMDLTVKQMVKLIESDADSFAKRAEMFYKQRPKLITHVEEMYRMYRALSDRYGNLTGELRKTVPLLMQSKGAGTSSESDS